MIQITEANYNDVLRIRRDVMYPDKDIEFVKLPDDDMGIHLGVFENNELVTVVSIFMGEDRNVQFRKLATRVDVQHQGFATAMMKWLIDYATDVKINRLWCNARTESIDFYKKFGFKETGKTFKANNHTYSVMEKNFSHN